MHKFIKKSLVGLCMLAYSCVFAAPQEIIIVRHADKLAQKNHGPTLSPTGYVRAVKLASYILHTYGAPDVLIAANPNQSSAQVASIRELQTLAPLANELTMRYPNTDHPILDPYTVPEYAQLATFVLTDARFNGKFVLICWDHHTIPHLVNAFGVKENQPVWQGTDFDSVYILKFNAQGQITTTLLHEQYPVTPVTDWTQAKEQIQS